MAARESPLTTKLYDRTAEVITFDEVERIVLSRSRSPISMNIVLLPSAFQDAGLLGLEDVGLRILTQDVAGLNVVAVDVAHGRHVSAVVPVELCQRRRIEGGMGSVEDAEVRAGVNAVLHGGWHGLLGELDASGGQTHSCVSARPAGPLTERRRAARWAAACPG